MPKQTIDEAALVAPEVGAHPPPHLDAQRGEGVLEFQPSAGHVALRFGHGRYRSARPPWRIIRVALFRTKVPFVAATALR